MYVNHIAIGPKAWEITFVSVSPNTAALNHFDIQIIHNIPTARVRKCTVMNADTDRKSIILYVKLFPSPSFFIN